jgi:hypothetical protein
MLTENDIERTEQLGYIIDIGKKLAAELLNEHFPGIELTTLSTQVDNLLMAHAEKPVYKHLIIKETPEPYFEIVYRSANHHDPKKGLELIRSFYFKQEILTAKHAYFSLPEDARYKGIGTEILAVFFDQYINMGVGHVELLTGLKDGGAVWVRLGFNALYKHEMEEILNAAEEALPGTPQLQLAKAIFDSYYGKEPNGKSFPIRRWAELDEMDPILKQHSWHGWIDLTNREELSNFKTNVGR